MRSITQKFYMERILEKQVFSPFGISKKEEAYEKKGI